ncbi:MAG: hypothetical protein RL743_679 [Actinomycetota bacterium]|jgi:hypothetical protein
MDRKRASQFFFTAVAVVGTTLFVGCGGDGSSARVIRVPNDAATITEAVDDAKPGTTIEIAPGTYNEAVEVSVERITIRGTDRNGVILDGEHRLTNGFSVVANDVAIENLTVRNYLQNGIVFNGVSAATNAGESGSGVAFGTGDAVLTGYRTSWVTTYNNGLYGIYAFASRDGLIEHSLASGHPDSGLYIGQCNPCNAVIIDSIAEKNAIGYYGTNASGGVVVARSVFRNNRLGIAPNSQDMEKLAPQADATIVGNLVADNDDPAAPAIPEGFFGSGIAVGGGTKNLITRNRVTGHDRAGIEILRLADWAPENNRIVDNVLSDNAVDLLFAVTKSKGSAGNCFSGNDFKSSVPADVETLMPCDGASRDFEMPASATNTPPPRIDYRKIPEPTPQESMPPSAQRTVAGAGAVPVVDIDAIAVP